MVENKQRGKGIFVKILTLVATVALIFALVVVPSSASVTASNITSYSGTYSAGIPMSFQWYNDAFSPTISGLVTSANVYQQSYGASGYSTSASTYGSFTPFFYYQDAPSSNYASDVTISEPGWDCIGGYIERSFAYYEGLPLETFTTNVIYSVTQTGVLEGLKPPSLPVTYTYDVSFLSGNEVEANFEPFSIGIETEIAFLGSGSSYTVVVPMLRADHLNTVLSSADAVGYEADVMLVRRISYRIDGDFFRNVTVGDTFGENVYVDDGVREDNFLNNIEYALTATFDRLIDDVNVTVDVSAISWTTWLKNAVAGFLNFELMPGLSLAGILGILLGIPLLLWFLKLFAGG